MCPLRTFLWLGELQIQKIGKLQIPLAPVGAMVYNHLRLVPQGQVGRLPAQAGGEQP